MLGGSALQLLAVGSSQRDVWRLGESLSTWWAIIVVVAIVAFSAAVYLLEPKVRRGKLKSLLFVLRALVLIGVGLIFLDPIESRETVEVRDAYSVVLLDKSISMTFKDRYEQGDFAAKLSNVTGSSYSQLLEEDRMTRVRKAMANADLGFLKKLRKNNKVRIYAFDSDRTTVVELEQLDTAMRKLDGGSGVSDSDKNVLINEDEALRLIDKIVKADGTATAIGDALNRVQKDLRSEKVSALVMLTDGRQNSGSLDPVEEATRYGRRRIPIYAVGVGDPRMPRDLILDNLQAPDVSIVGDLISYDCVVKAQGYEEPVDVDVELLFDGVVRERSRVRVGGEIKEKAVRLRTKPTQPGEYKTEVKISVLSTEMTAENNRAFHNLRVIDQRIKLLYIDGYPRWEYRYLKNALIRDRSMEAQCLLLSAEPGFPQEASPGLKRLTEVPTRKELLEYHVIIVGDVSPQAKWQSTGKNVFKQEFWDTLVEFVGDFGGGLLLISGERDNPRHFSQLPISKLFPVVVDSRGRSGGRYTEIFFPKLTRMGQRSPLMRLDPDPGRNNNLWKAGGQGLPGFYWYERAIKAKPLARVLSVHPTESNEYGDYPLFAWQYFKSGTVFWSAVDSTWRWRAGVGDKFTYRFYGQIIRFLSHGRFQRSKRFSITTDKKEYSIGDEVYITARVYTRDLKPSTAKEQTAEIDKPDGTREKLTLRLIDGKPGRYEGTYRAVARGRYKANLVLGDLGSGEEVAPRPFMVKLPSAELAESRMDEETLKKIADSSGGQFFRLADLDQIPDLIPSRREKIPLSASERKLWDNRYVLGLLILLLVIEWIGRKYIRLL